MKFSTDSDGFRRWHEAGKGQAPTADTQIVTSEGHRIAAHSNVLASASPVLENLVYKPRKNWNSQRIISILGVPSDVVFTFLHFIYSSRMALPSGEGKEAMEEYGVQLMMLAHKFGIDWLKKGCEVEVGRQLSAESAVDVLQVSRVCNAPSLYHKCLRLISQEFSSVQISAGWRFVQMNDPRLELEILQHLDDTDQRRKRWKRQREEQEMYRQLGEAMDCLEHICTEGCTNVGPHERAPPCKSKGPCTRFRTCEALQLLIRHFATCSSKKLSNAGSCSHCKRMWQLFRLHSSLCERKVSCKVPLCKQFKLSMQINEKGDDVTWQLLVKKVAVARVMSSLARRKRPEQIHNLWAKIRHKAQSIT